MAAKASKTAGLTVKTYRGDAKTVLAMNLPNRAAANNLAGFTIQCKPPGQDAFFLLNNLQFEIPGKHTQDATEPAASSINAPFQKFRWLHVPGTFHTTNPTFGTYTYTVTPRFFDESHSLAPVDPKRSVAVNVEVGPLRKAGVELGFTRGFIQSQAFVHHFGLKAVLRPNGKDLIYDTSQNAGTNSQGVKFSFADEYQWSGYTARAQIFAILNEVRGDKSLHLDVFAYDLNEPDVINILLELAKEARVRVILDNSKEHHSTSSPKAEDQFAALFAKSAKGQAAVRRGHFKRLAHDKIFIVSGKGQAQKVLTGSTNFSINGLYVNSNHVIVFNDPQVAAKYQQVFDAVWQGNAAEQAFLKSPLASETFQANSKTTPATEITFSPHAAGFAGQILDGIASRVKQEAKAQEGSVLFAVMDLGGGGNLLSALRTLHADQKIFSFGVTDTASGIQLYEPGKKTGVLVTGKPAKTKLPPPFDQVASIGSDHQVHHKFVVCGFNGKAPVVYCGSSNLALGGEQANGDNLIAIHDGDIATAFAIEALALVDHFQFLDRTSSTKAAKGKRAPKFASKQQQAVSAELFLDSTDKWAAPYFDSNDLHCVDRELFG
jgi:PLD-like domain